MKVVFIGGRQILKLGGIENYTLNLASWLVKRGHTPIVYCESDHNGSEMINGFLTIHQKSIGNRYFDKPFLGLIATIRSLFRDFDAEVYHYNAWPPSFLASWIPRLLGKVVVMQGHGFEWKRTKYSKFQRAILKFMERLTACLNKNLMMVSQEQSDHFLKAYNRKCITVPGAIDLPKEGDENPGRKILERNSLQKGGYFLFLGRLVKEKNPDVLIKAYLKSGIKDRKLVIAGDNPSDPAFCEALRKSANGSQEVVFTGAVYGEEKNALLGNCFAFCLPSTIEGLPITLLEAMSFKRLNIVSDIPSCKEALGDAGLFVKPEDEEDLADKLRLSVKGVGSFDHLCEEGYRRVAEKFTWDKITDLYVRELEKLASKRNG